MRNYAGCVPADNAEIEREFYPSAAFEVGILFLNKLVELADSRIKLAGVQGVNCRESSCWCQSSLLPRSWRCDCCLGGCGAISVIESRSDGTNPS